MTETGFPFGSGVAGEDVKYIDLRVQPEHLTAFVECLLDDGSNAQVVEFLTNVAESKNIALDEW